MATNLTAYISLRSTLTKKEHLSKYCDIRLHTTITIKKHIHSNDTINHNEPKCIEYHHYHVVQQERISLNLSRHFLSFIASGRSSGLDPVSCCMYVRVGRPAFAQPYVEVYRSTSLMSSSLLLQQCPTCLVRLTWIVFLIGGMWPYSRCLLECCRQDLFIIARNILV